jgi:hypothetical protein
VAQRRVMRFVYLVAIAFCAFLVGCDQAALMKKFTPPEEESIAKSYVALLQQGKFDQIEHDLDSSLIDSNLRNTLSKMAAFFPSESPQSVKVVGAHIYRDEQSSKVDITFEYQFPSKWLLVNVTTQKNGDVRTVIGLHVTPIADSLENLNKFTLVGKSALQYLTLVCDVGSLLFTLYVFALCIRSKDMNRKWLWLIVVLVGVGKFAVNWGTGQWTYQLIAIQIPCFSMTHPLYGPWTVAAYVPLGAMVFLHRRWKMKTTGGSIPPPVHVSE